MTFVFFVLQMSISFAQKNEIAPLKVEKGELIFSDDFERKEIGSEWTIKDKFEGAFSIQKGVFVGKELKDAGHGSVTRTNFEFSDVVIEFDLKFDGGKRLNIVMDDSNCKSVWAGHISRVAFSKTGFKVQDDKTGVFDLKIRNQLKENPEKKTAMKDFLDSKMNAAKLNFEKGKWYHVRITKVEDILECIIGGVITQVKSEGIGHPNLNKFGPTITGGDILFDNFKVWKIK